MSCYKHTRNIYIAHHMSLLMGHAADARAQGGLRADTVTKVEMKKYWGDKLENLADEAMQKVPWGGPHFLWRPHIPDVVTRLYRPSGCTRAYAH